MQRCVGKFSPKDDSIHSVAIPSGLLHLKYVKKIASSDTFVFCRLCMHGKNYRSLDRCSITHPMQLCFLGCHTGSKLKSLNCFSAGSKFMLLIIIIIMHNHCTCVLIELCTGLCTRHATAWLDLWIMS